MNIQEQPMEKSVEEEVSSRPKTFKVSGKSKIKHNYSGKAAEMVDKTIEEMEKMGIKNPYAQIGILSVIGKESGFTAIKEMGYCTTSDSRIESIFGGRGTKCKSLKCDDPKFFDCVYGKDSGMPLGNTAPGDGWKYVGRGLNGITGKANYKHYGNLIGVDLVSNPELLEKPEISAKAAIAFFLGGKKADSLPDFKDKLSAINYFTDLNAGGRRSEWSRTAAVKASSNFDIA
jgi:predicted chitinase